MPGGRGGEGTTDHTTVIITKVYEKGIFKFCYCMHCDEAAGLPINFNCIGCHRKSEE